MRRNALWLLLAFVLVVNAGALASAWYNRSGQPDAVMELTERELRLPPRQAENTALALALVWDDSRQGRPDARREYQPWFDRAKLESIGFDCSRPATPANRFHYRRQSPPRAAYVVLEVAAAPAATQQAVGGSYPTHLMSVDAGNDPRQLRARYPDRSRYAVVAATVGLVFVDDVPGKAPFLAGRVQSLEPAELAVPRQWRSLLETLQTEQEQPWSGLAHPPRYRVTVKWGKNLEPWIERIAAIQ